MIKIFIKLIFACSLIIGNQTKISAPKIILKSISFDLTFSGNFLKDNKYTLKINNDEFSPDKQTKNDISFNNLKVFDTGATFRVGARFVPSGIKENSLLLRPYNPAQEIKIFKYYSGIDYGDITIVRGYLPESHKLIEQETASLIQPNILPIFMGGDHSISLPVLRSIKKNMDLWG